MITDSNEKIAKAEHIKRSCSNLKFQIFSVYGEYRNARRSRKECFLEPWKKVLADIDKVIIDKNQVQG